MVMALISGETSPPPRQVTTGGTGDYIGVVRLFGVVLVWKVVSIYPSFKSI